jgi:EmrB/QacA subfamily drug resistance transporter
MPFIRLPGDGVVVRSTSNAALSGTNARPWVLAATILASSMAFIDGTVVNVALPSLQTSLHATVVDVQWVVISYGLLLAALILVGGSLGDMWGRRRMFLAGVVVFALASVACGFASNISQLVIARSIQGVGAAFLVPGSLSIISASFNEKDRGQAIGTWSGFTSITTAIGPVLGGWLIQHASWRWAFFINLPIAIAVIVISLWRVPESRSATSDRIDWLGAVIVTFGLGGLVYGFVESANLGWGNPLVFGSLFGGVACLIIFVMVEVRQKSPMVPLTLFSSRTFSGANLLTLFLYSAIGIFFFLFPLDLIQVQGYSATAAGAAMLPLIMILFLLSRWSGGLVARYGPEAPLIVGPLIAATGFALFVLPSTGGSYWTGFLPAILVLGLGMAVTVAPLTTVLMNSVTQDRIGAASGINNTVARVASVLAIAVLGIVMVNAFRSHLNPELAKLSLASATLHEIQASEINLAGLELPAELDSNEKNIVRESVHTSFVFGFRMIMWICAGLSLASAGVAWTMISANTLDPSQKPRPLA